jgi:hypothetical protein
VSHTYDTRLFDARKQVLHDSGRATAEKLLPYYCIFNLRLWSIHVGEAPGNGTESPTITIGSSALLDTLPELYADAMNVTVTNFALTCQSDVEAPLSNSISFKACDLTISRAPQHRGPCG